MVTIHSYADATLRLENYMICDSWLLTSLSIMKMINPLQPTAQINNISEQKWYFSNKHRYKKMPPADVRLCFHRLQDLGQHNSNQCPTLSEEIVATADDPVTWPYTCVQGVHAKYHIWSKQNIQVLLSHNV